MTQSVLINQTTFRILYLKYKEYTLPLIVIGICLLLFLFFVIPQMETWFSLSAATADEQNKLAILQQNVAFASQLDQATLAQQLSLVSKALPEDKDFEAVLNAVSNAAVSSQVSLGDYNFVVGDLSKLGAKESNLKIAITVLGDIQDVQRYILSLKKQFPLSEITSIGVTPSGSTINVIFYFQTIGKIPFDDTTPLSPLSKKEKDLLTSLTAIQE